MNKVEVKGLSKTYKDLKAVDNLDLVATEGEILALAGPDGAGKTSTFRSICGLLHFDEGEIKVAGYDVRAEFDRIKQHLGYMPEAFSLYPDLTVEENLYFYAGLFGLSRSEFQDKKKRLYEFSALGPFHDRRAAALSGGMKQKLALSCALVHDPEVLILDEPTTGVDPLSRRQFWDILKSLRESGSTIVVSTPYMDEVALADRTVFIFQGEKLAEGTPTDLVKMFAGKVYEARVNPTAATMEELSRIEGLTSRRFGSSIHLYVSEHDSIENYHAELSNAGIEADLISSTDPELEDTFIQLMGK
jgi:ABC-2 type transport system ATP-binding protein